MIYHATSPIAFLGYKVVLWSAALFLVGVGFGSALEEVWGKKKTHLDKPGGRWGV